MAFFSFISLGSGSKGNAFVIGNGNDAILIDAGFSAREMTRRLHLVGLDPRSVRAVLLTHEHRDHVAGCRVFCNAHGIPLYLSGLAADRLYRENKLPARICQFQSERAFELAGFAVHPFSVQHDALDPVGFELTAESIRIGFATDLGQLNDSAKNRLANCDILVLESNYDAEMLRNSDRPLHLKRRICGKFGHLGNENAAEALELLVGGKTRVVMLAHVSRECNTYEQVEEYGRSLLDRMGRADVRLLVLRQDEPGPAVRIGAAGFSCA